MYGSDRKIHKEKCYFIWAMACFMGNISCDGHSVSLHTCSVVENYESFSRAPACL